MIFDKGAKTVNGVKTVPSTNRAGTTWTFTATEVNLDKVLTASIKINSTGNVDLNMKHKIITLLELNIRGNIDDLGYTFLDTTPKIHP